MFFPYGSARYPARRNVVRMVFASSRTSPCLASKRSEAMPMVTARRKASIVRIEPTNISVGPSCSPGDRRCHQRPRRNPISDAMIADDHEPNEHKSDRYRIEQLSKARHQL